MFYMIDLPAAQALIYFVISIDRLLSVIYDLELPSPAEIISRPFCRSVYRAGVAR